MRKKSLAHLKIHGIKSWEQYESHMARRNKNRSIDLPLQVGVNQVLNMARSLDENVLTNLSIPEEVRSVIYEKVRSVIDVVALRRVLRLARLYQALDMVDHKLLVEKIEQMDTSQLLLLLKILSDQTNQLQEGIDQIRRQDVDDKRESQVSFSHTEKREISIPSDPRERENLRLQVLKLLGMRSNRGGTV